ncbi:MAG: hypothetical protein AVDCRST_MAG77-4026 [uncultured Chloroflexi bacterium]|uniref:Uncharacterized protein n=1 Tax=uncultured Chloroflexota bacterium TaxID=166587 RepID=A0A6J4JNC8_9CHLR|nr:MAG: hypothetical protein AVDCRST_MAG77-4026 [uncultured Chloroflexota bacterium]
MVVIDCGVSVQTEKPRVGSNARGALTSSELLALQLLERGYTLPQAAWLTGNDDCGMASALAGAVWALGAVDVAEALAIARERRLII